MPTPFKSMFKNQYLKSLHRDFRFYYDDIHEYGDRRKSKHAFYFVPGINGTPGQIRFAFPAIGRHFAPNTFIKCLYLPEFSAQKPIWEKYTIANVVKKKWKIADDLNEMTDIPGKIYVVASSNGFYDFLHAYDSISNAAKEKIILIWTACAPDHYNSAVFHKLFYKINGFKFNDHEWVAFPNSNILKFINPETSTTYTGTYNGQSKTYFKTDLESRFCCFNTNWYYLSISCYNQCLSHILKNAHFEDIPGGALADLSALANGTTFPTFAGSPAVGFTPRGIPVDLNNTTTPGSGAGAFYITDNNKTVYATVLLPLGGIRVRVLDPIQNNWL